MLAESLVQNQIFAHCLAYNAPDIDSNFYLFKGVYLIHPGPYLT